MKIAFSFLFTLLFLFDAQASKEFIKTLNKYSNAKTLEVSLKKTDEKTTLGTKSTSQGLLKFSKNKIYIVLNGDKKVEFYYNKKTIWLVEYPDLDFDKDGKRKITILKKSTPVLMSSLINLFSDQKKFLNEFKVQSEKKDGDKLTVQFKPAQKNLKSFILVIGAKDRVINEVVFTDDVDTTTTLQLSSLVLNKKFKNSEFEFKKIKSDEVTYE